MIGKLALAIGIAAGAAFASQTQVFAEDAQTPPAKAPGQHNFNIDERIKMADDLVAAAQKDGKTDAATALKGYSDALKKLKAAQTAGDDAAIKTAQDDVAKAKTAAADYLPKHGHKKN